MKVFTFLIVSLSLNTTYIDLFLNIAYLHNTQFIFLHFFSPSVRMSGKSINFDDKKINKSNFSKNKKIFNIYDLDVKRYNKILKKNSNLMNTEFDSEPAYGDNDKCRKTKIKLYGDKINTNKYQSQKNTKRKCII